MKLQDLVKLKPIIEAIEQGNTIQYKDGMKDIGLPWYEIDIKSKWNFNGTFPEDYRIKPEPIEWYEIWNSSADILIGRDFKSVSSAKDYAKSNAHCNARIFHVTEVIE